jgi:biopolymer transport protein ExbD
MLNFKKIALKDAHENLLKDYKIIQNENNLLKAEIIDKDIKNATTESTLKRSRAEIALNRWLVPGIDFAMLQLVIFIAGATTLLFSSATSQKTKALLNLIAPGIISEDKETKEPPLIITVLKDNLFSINNKIYNSRSLINELDRLKKTGEISKNKKTVISGEGFQDLINYLDKNTAYQGTLK